MQVHLEVQHLAQYLTSWKLLGNEFLLPDLSYMIVYAKHAYMSASGKRKASEVRICRMPHSRAGTVDITVSLLKALVAA